MHCSRSQSLFHMAEAMREGQASPDVMPGLQYFGMCTKIMCTLKSLPAPREQKSVVLY